jgi:hypothetical protein
MNKCCFLVSAVILSMLMVGCPRRESQPTPKVPTPPTPSQTPAQLVPLTDNEIQDIINNSLKLLNLARQQMACAARQAGNTGTSGRISPGLDKTNGYGIWLNYIATHIKSGIPFDSTYSDIASGALDVSAWSDPTGEACLNGGTKDTDLQQAMASVDPAQIGQQLFTTFRPYDQSTRDRAAQMLSGQ